MPTLLIDYDGYKNSFHCKTNAELYGGLHWLLRNIGTKTIMTVLIHDRDRGMNTFLDVNDTHNTALKSWKSIYNSFGIKSFYTPNNSQTINNYFCDAVLPRDLVKDMDKVKQEGIWVVPRYPSIRFYPIYVLRDTDVSRGVAELKEFINSYDKIAKMYDTPEFDMNIECIRKVKFEEDGFFLETVIMV